VSVKVSRRSFLKAGAAVTATLALPDFVTRSGQPLTALAARRPPDYGKIVDIYRNKWTWDKTVRGTHMINCWYQAHCAFDVYVRDGIVFREEQAADYPQLNPDVPDMNPRGCQKGCSFSQRMYEESRIRYPLKQTGKRGSGEWARVSWDEALDDIADKFLDVIIEEGTDRVIWDMGPDINVGAANAAQARLAQLTHSISLDSNSSNGDAHRGAFETFGNIYMDRSIEDYFYSDVILFWGCNPIVTSIPNAHFFTEAKYNGSQIVCIAPDYSPSAIKADLWVPLDPGTDAALALAVAREIVEGGHVDEAFVAEQTDLPLLVRMDTGKLLTEAEAKRGRTDRFTLMDETRGPMTAPAKSLDLGGLTPVLDVDTEITLPDRSRVHVRSVYSLLKDRLKPYTFEAVSEMTGTPVKVIEKFTRLCIGAKALSNVSGSSMNKYFHGNLTERAMILIWVLRGQMGKPGSGYSAFSFLANDGWEDYVSGFRNADRAKFGWDIGTGLLGKLAAGDTAEMFFKDLGHNSFKDIGGNLPIWTSSAMFWHIHGGVMELAEEAAQWVPGLKKTVKDSVVEALDNHWVPVQPPRGSDPRIMFHYCSNPLRSVRGSQKLLEVLWPKLKLSVTIDFRMSSTAMWSDYILPAAAWYETTDHKWVTPLVPFNHVTNKAVEPLGEAKPDFWIFTMLAKHMEKRAKERGLTTITSHLGKTIKLDNLYDDMTMSGRFLEDDTDKAAGAIIEASANLSHVSWEEQKEKGYARYNDIGISPLAIGNAGKLEEGKAFIPLTYHLHDKYPYPTQTRRIQFYIDHDLYLEHDEHLPTYKAPPKIGGDYPLMMTGGHTRWSIHGVWRDNRLMNRLNRGQPYIMIGVEDAKARGINDGDWVRCYNDVGSFELRVKVTHAMRPGQAFMYHAWENYQFEGKGEPRHVSPSPINPVELAGDHAHLRVGMLEGQPNCFDRDTRIEMERISGPRKQTAGLPSTGLPEKVGTGLPSGSPAA
jgi:DMSO reductase family type II enzyme molybdopterin subunit